MLVKIIGRAANYLLMGHDSREEGRKEKYYYYVCVLFLYLV